jgi:hypothetical protein
MGRSTLGPHLKSDSAGVVVSAHKLDDPASALVFVAGDRVIDIVLKDLLKQLLPALFGHGDVAHAARSSCPLTANEQRRFHPREAITFELPGSLTQRMVDCPERNRMSQEISKAVRDEIRARKQATADPVQSMASLRKARQNLRRLRAEYRVHVTEHGCLPGDGAQRAADASG